MLTVNYITRPWFLDISLELIRELKTQVNLNVIIIISPDNAGYLGISSTDAERFKNKTLQLNKVLSSTSLERFNPYFNGANVICKFEEHKESSYKNTLSWIRILYKNTYLLNADLNIIESLSLADWYFLFKIRNKRIFYILHDPVPHTGEKRSRAEVISMIYFPYIQKFITYSNYSTQLFEQHYSKHADKTLTLRMPVFSSQKLNGLGKKKSVVKKIVFFGRISPYKGVELFYAAAAILSQRNDNLQFIIAGKAIENYEPDFLNDNQFDNIKILNKFIDLEELADLLSDASFCVLPYFDATQSGVIMTCYAYNVPVLVSDCQGLLEYCFDKENFSFKNKDVDALIERMQNLINHDLLLSNNRRQIELYSSQNVSLLNCNAILNQL